MHVNPIDLSSASTICAQLPMVDFFLVQAKLANGMLKALAFRFQQIPAKD